MLDKAREFAHAAHADQKYGDRPYSFHLDAVAKLLEPYGENAQVIGYLHDVLEDTEVDRKALEATFGPSVAGCIATLTDDPGESRRERKQRTYARLAKLELALMVLTADRLANIQACIADKNEDLLKMYRKERDDFKNAVYRLGLCDDLWAVIDATLDGN